MDATFAEKLKSGDAECFMQAFSEVSDELYRVAYIYVKNGEDARDVVQETAYRCFKGIGKLKSPEYFRTWAVKTAINCALDILRKNRRTVSLEDRPDILAEAPSPESAAVASVTLDRLMNSLNEREKSAVILRHICDLSLEEISRAMKIPLSTAKTTLYRAMDKLRKESLENEE